MKLNFKIKSAFAIVAAGAALILLFAIVSCGLLNPVVSTETAKPAIAKGTEVEIEIMQGANLTQIAEMLAEKGIVDDAFVFRLYVQEQGKEKNLLPGTYRLITGDEYKNILAVITAGEKQVIYKLTIPEGFTLNQVKERIIADIPFVELQELESALDINTYKDSYEFLSDKTTLEGFLFPKTYDITVQYTAKNIIEMLITQYQLETQPLDWSYAADNNFSNYDILKIASLIEREAYIPDERPLISAVIYNRLKIDMLLQIDATVRYALDKWEGIVTYDDLEVDSPYNTYKYTGLTPTPICNPGMAAIKAALAPEAVDYLFYVVVDEKTHQHEFSKTFQEHVNATNQ
jgi:UPF0755 protein